MVRTVDSFSGRESASARRTSSAVAERRSHTTCITTFSSSLRGLRCFRELNIVALRNVALLEENVKGGFVGQGILCSLPHERLRGEGVVHIDLGLDFHGLAVEKGRLVDPT